MTDTPSRHHGRHARLAFHEPIPAPAPLDWRPLPPGSWLGVLGGGQLGRMFCQAAQRLGYRVCVLDPDADGIAARVADHHIRADYLDDAALVELGTLCDAVTTEFENVPAAALDRLAMLTRVAPTGASVAVAQDRVAEKAFFTGAGVPVAPYRVIETLEDIDGVPDTLFPAILKVARLGYDGKGQARVATREAARGAFESFTAATSGRAPVCVLEQQVPLAAEVSVLLARGADGQVAVYPLAANEHRQGILAVSTVPAAVSPALAEQARAAAVSLAERLEYRGILCIEFFVLEDGRLLANEMAPRPHNSGHWTLDAADCSQFEQQVRVMAGLPLGSTAQVRPVIMLNILGNAWYQSTGQDASGRPAAAPRAVDIANRLVRAAEQGRQVDVASHEPTEPDWSAVLAHPGAHLHLYGKDEARMGRKMGHVNIVADTLDAAREQAAAIGHQVAQPLVEG